MGTVIKIKELERGRKDTTSVGGGVVKKFKKAKAGRECGE
jgi:hypothetical protein